jgi:tetratricopeptide (TPR) repeat protein
MTAYQNAVKLNPKDALTHAILGGLFAQAGETVRAIDAYRRAIELEPKEAGFHNNLGNILAENGDLEGGLAAYRNAVRLNPRNAIAQENVGLTLEKMGDLPGAISAYQVAIKLNPKLASAHQNLGWLLATGPEAVADGKRAVEHAMQSCELTGWKRASNFVTLGAAYAAAGDFDRAIEYQNRALKFPEYEKAHGKAARVRLELYARRKPYRDPALHPRELAPPPRAVR